MVPAEILGHIRNGDPAPVGLSDAEKRAYDQTAFATYHRGYGVIQGTRPQTIGYSLGDAPVGLAAWLLDHDAGTYEHLARLFTGSSTAPSRAMTGSTTPRCTGSRTRPRPRRGCTGSKP